MTHYRVNVTILGQKPRIDAKGGRNFKVYQEEFQARVKVLKEG